MRIGVGLTYCARCVRMRNLQTALRDLARVRIRVRLGVQG